MNLKSIFYEEKEMLSSLIEFYLHQMKNNKNFFDVYYVAEPLLVLVSVNVSENVTTE